MSNASNLLFLLIPEEFFGLILLCLIVGGGFALILGYPAQGKALILTAIALPLVSFVVGVLMNEMFMALPGWLVTPVAMLLMLIIYLMIGWALVKLVFGQKAIEEAKGHLLADAIKGLLRMIFTRSGFVALGSVFLLLYLNVGG